MRSIYRPETSFIYRLLLFLVIVIAGLTLTYFLFWVILFAQSGFDFALTNEKLATLNDHASLLQILQTLQSFLVFIFPPFVLARLYHEPSRNFIHLKKPKLSSALLGIFSIVLLIPIINMLVAWNTGLHLPESMQGLESWMRSSEDAAEKVTRTMLGGSSMETLFINLLIIGVLAGIGEEFLFRGALQSLFCAGLWPDESTKKPDWVMHAAIWSVAILFSAIHLQFYGFIPRMLLGAWFGYLLWWSGSIWVPVLAHLTNNAISTILTFLENKGQLSQNPDQIGLHETWWLCVLSVFLLTGCIYLLLQEKKKNGRQQLLSL